MNSGRQPAAGIYSASFVPSFFCRRAHFSDNRRFVKVIGNDIAEAMNQFLNLKGRFYESFEKARLGMFGNRLFDEHCGRFELRAKKIP
jgi:hypothetical protein